MENLGCLASGELKNSQICLSKLRIVFKFTFSTIRQYPVEVVRFVVEVLKILEETKLNVDQCPPSHQEITSRNGVQMAFLPVYAFIELHRFPFRRSTSTVHQSQARCRTRITAYVVKREPSKRHVTACMSERRSEVPILSSIPCMSSISQRMGNLRSATSSANAGMSKAYTPPKDSR